VYFVVGAASQARLCHRILIALGHELPIVYDRTPDLVPAWNCEIIRNESLIPAYAQKCNGFLVCIGDEHGERREYFSRLLLSLGLEAVSAVHPTAFLGETVKRGRGLQAMPHAVVNEFAEIGDWCILNTNCTVDHECRLGNAVHIMGGASLAGLVTVGDYSIAGTNATVLPRLNIGRNCYIGAGAVVTKDVADNTVMVGVPARILKTRNTPQGQL
jgi:sugar O-acyltransferase (sialic acid O-acetyltransferase NeuD family)